MSILGTAVGHAGATDPPDSSALLTLNSELREFIFSYLNWEDIYALKKSCKTLNVEITPMVMSRQLVQKYYRGDQNFHTNLGQSMSPMFGSGSILAKRLENYFSQYDKNAIPDQPMKVGAFLRTLSNHNRLAIQCVKTLRYKKHIKRVMPLRDGRLVFWFHKRSLEVWDVNRPTGEEWVKTLAGFDDEILGVLQLTDGRLMSCSVDNTLKVWDMDNPKGQEHVRTLVGHDRPVRGAIQLRNGWLVSWSYDGTLKV